MTRGSFAGLLLAAFLLAAVGCEGPPSADAAADGAGGTGAGGAGGAAGGGAGAGGIGGAGDGGAGGGAGGLGGAGGIGGAGGQGGAGGSAGAGGAGGAGGSAGAGGVGGVGGVQRQESSCSDGIDDDDDGALDCADTDCLGDPSCAPPAESCANGLDDDGDGNIDCADLDCLADPACAAPPEDCANALDDDFDGTVDCADSDCVADPACAVLPESCANGLDDDRDGDADCADADCLGDPACVLPPEDCSNRADDDGDGDADCLDRDCRAEVACVIGACAGGNVLPAAPSNVSGQNALSNADQEGSCGSDTLGSNDDVWAFTATAAGDYVFDTIGTSSTQFPLDVVIYVLDACGGAELACSDDGSMDTPVTVNLFPGQIVYVVVDGANGSMGQYELNARAPRPPPSAEVGNCANGIDDDGDGAVDCLDPDCGGDPACPGAGCADFALAAVVPQTVSGDTTGASPSFNGGCGTSGGSSDELWSFTAPADADYTFDTAGSSYDTVLFVLSDCLAGAVLDCNDDFGGNTTSEITVTLTAGQTVYVAVSGYNGADGTYTLHVQ